jgi:hypothetical protein
MSGMRKTYENAARALDGLLLDGIVIAAGGAGIAALYTRTGVGTLIADGKESREFHGERYLMETGLTADLAIVKAWRGDPHGNLVYRKSARNFNPMAAACGCNTVAEVEHLVRSGDIDPDHVHTAGIFVQRLIASECNEKRIEQRTVLCILRRQLRDDSRRPHRQAAFQLVELAPGTTAGQVRERTEASYELRLGA